MKIKGGGKMKHYKYKGKVYDEIEMFNKLIELEEIQEVPFITYRDRDDMVMGTENDDTATMVDEVIENTELDIIEDMKGKTK